MKDVVIIDLWPPMAICCICGVPTLSRWGIPVDSEIGLIVANDYPGEWGGQPACSDCWRKHEGGAFVGTYPRF